MENEIVKWIKNYCVDNKILTLVVGISGGIDSALVSTLCAMTGLRTVIVSMPIHQNQDQLTRAGDHADWLLKKFNNVECVEKDLTSLFECFKSLFDKSETSEISLANSRARLRMTTLYQFAGAYGGIVVGTGNSIEDNGIGFFAKYGDGGVDLSPIADLTKTEVRKMAKKLEINNEILIAPPTDGLYEIDRPDESQIGATYEELEEAMDFFNLNGDPNNLNGRKKEVYIIYKTLNDKNKHKMVPIPVFKKGVKLIN